MHLIITELWELLPTESLTLPSKGVHCSLLSKQHRELASFHAWWLHKLKTGNQNPGQEAQPAKEILTTLTTHAWSMFSSHFIPSPGRQQNRGWKKLNSMFEAESFKSFSLQVFSLPPIANEFPPFKFFPGERRQKKALETHHRYGESASVNLLLLWLNYMASSQIWAWGELNNVYCLKHFTNSYQSNH